MFPKIIIALGHDANEPWVTMQMIAMLLYIFQALHHIPNPE
jgi:hypothetical protein